MKPYHMLLSILLSVMPAVASADPVVKCVQTALKEAGNNPRGVDGILGPNTRRAAASWLRRNKADLPDLSTETAPRWCATLLSANESLPQADPGTERYCIWFEEVTNGVWLDPNGVPVLLFRFASGEKNAGCYAWLNTNDSWQISEAGTQILRVETNDNQRSWGQDGNRISVNVDTGLASYLQNGFTTFGVLTD